MHDIYKLENEKRQLIETALPYKIKINSVCLLSINFIVDIVNINYFAIIRIIFINSSYYNYCYVLLCYYTDKIKCII
jgi:hypothetical protein